ncbi:hypothetical protein FDECE_3468 [Fusarium decemcellulare]|nr:hypothetical protein FDECE_3468 [Fusarium decemcellulare]
MAYTLQTLFAGTLYYRNFNSATESTPRLPQGVQRMSSAIRARIRAGIAAIIVGSVFQMVSWSCGNNGLDDAFGVVAIILYSLFQVSMFPEEALSAAEAFQSGQSFEDFWDENEFVWRLSVIPFVFLVIATVTASVLRIVLPSRWPAAWMMSIWQFAQLFTSLRTSLNSLVASWHIVLRPGSSICQSLDLGRESTGAAGG